LSLSAAPNPLDDESSLSRVNPRNLSENFPFAAAEARFIATAFLGLLPLSLSRVRGYCTAKMAHWLMKSEPSSYSWDDLVRDGGTEWDGVRNPTARINLKAMKVGDTAFFYRSVAEPAVVGIMRVVREAEPDPKDPKWVSVRVEPVCPLGPVTLKAIKAEPKLAAMELLRQSRLSVAPVRDEEWEAVLKMAE
jgi:predicted RNA-binding protein with PUA-like domain